MENLLIIPARGGSKRILRKNIKQFVGKPIIQYSIEAALQSLLFDEVMVSTDDKEIAIIAESLGAQVPFMRSNTTSDDHATLADVLEEVLETYQQRGREFSYICCLLPTAPFITADVLKSSFYSMTEGGHSSLFPVIRFSYPIQRALKVDASSHKASMMWPEHLRTRSQDLPPAYHDAGLFYWARATDFLKEKNFLGEKNGVFELSPWFAQDIDTEEDWKMAEVKFSILHKMNM